MANWVEALEDFDQACLDKRGQKYKNFFELSRQEQKQLVMLRKNLINEESKEADEALLEVYDDVESIEARAHLTKELVDTIYVCIGTAVSLNLDIETAFQRVQDNNMLKIATGTYREDGKLIKSPDHPAVNLEDCV